VVLLSFSMFTHFQMNIRQNQLIATNVAMQQLTSGSVAWAIDTLNENWNTRKGHPPIDQLPIHFTKKINHFTIESKLIDAQAFLNLNNISDPAFQESFTKLLTLTSDEKNQGHAEDTAQILKDWITKQNKPANLDTFYKKQQPSYRAPHQKMVSRSELKLIKGMDAKIYKSIKPYVIALPTTTKVNINSVSPFVLTCLFKDINLKNAEEILSLRPFSDFAKTKELSLLKNLQIDISTMLTIDSIYFILKTKIITLHQQLILYTLLKRDVIEKHVQTRILWQTMETT
jgi:general secretion pathway protein K